MGFGTGLCVRTLWYQSRRVYGQGKLRTKTLSTSTYGNLRGTLRREPLLRD